MCLIRTGFIFIKHTIQNRPFASGLFCVFILCLPQRVFQLRKRDAGEKYAKTILENNKNLYGKIFEKYSGEDRLAFDNARESVANRWNVEKEPDRARTVDDTEREVRERGLEKISPTLSKTSYYSDKKRTLNILRMQGTNYPECLIIRVPMLLYAKLTRLSIKIKEILIK